MKRSLARWPARLLIVVVTYWVAGRLALLMAIPPGYATAVWPAAGIALVAVLVWSARVAPAVAVGSFLVNVGTSFDASSTALILRSIGVALAIATGAALQASIGAAAIRRAVGFPSALETPREIVWFMALGGPAACVVNATVGVTVLCGVGLAPWSTFLFSWWTWWTGDTIGVLIFSPLALLLVPGPHPVWRRRRASVGVTLVAGFAVVTVLFIRVSGWESVRIRRDFERGAVPVGHALESQFERYTDIVDSIASLLEASPEVSRDGFRAFVRAPLAGNAGIRGLAWDPVVADRDRAAFEEAARRDGLRDYHFTERDARGALVPAARRPQYVPIHYLEPLEHNRDALGFDVATDPARGALIERARRTGRASASATIGLLQERGQGRGLLLMAPVGGREPRGYAVGVFVIGDLIAPALRLVDPRDMELLLRDAADPDTGPPSYEQRGDGDPAGVLRWRTAIDFGGRTWTLELRATAGYLTRHRSWQAWIVLAGGLIAVALLGIIMLMTTGRASLSERAEQRFRDLFDNAPDMYAAIEPATGHVVECNQTLLATLGYRADEVVGRSVLQLYDPASRPDAEIALRRSTETGEIRDVELAVRRKDGTTIDVSLSVRALRDAAGRVVHSRSAWRDITERKEADRRFRALNAELETRVADRTRELSTALGEREVMLQEIHHRVKNNLQVISSLLNMQQRRLEAGPSRDALRDCQTRIQAISLIHEKLYQSRDYARVPFSAYARSLATSVFHAAGVSSAAVQLALDIEEVALPVDRAIPCGLILNELITNALKHAFPDGRRGTVRVELRQQDDGRVLLAVSDDGVGLPAGLDLAAQPSLGMQLVATLVAQLDAELEVAGPPGASFRVRFALAA